MKKKEGEPKKPASTNESGTGQGADDLLEGELDSAGGDVPKKIFSSNGLQIVFGHRTLKERMEEQEAQRQMETKFSRAYIPAIGFERRARAKWLANYARGGDPAFALSMKWQEERCAPYDEFLSSLFGQEFATWRLGLCLEAIDDVQTSREVGEFLAAAMRKGLSGELDEMARCMRAIQEVKSDPRSKRAVRLVAVLFAFRYSEKHEGKFPDRPTVRKFLVENYNLQNYGRPFSAERRNEKRDLFCGPILKDLPTGIGGRPKKPLRKPPSKEL